MLNRHSRPRVWAGAAATAALAAASLTVAAPGQAQQADKQKTERHITIIERHGDGERTAETHRHSEGDVVRRHLSPEIAARIEACRGSGELVDINEGEGNERVRMRLCTRGEGGSPAERAAALQRARDRVAEEDHLSAETRRRILAQLDAAIARARGN
jgi:hypothetical protein